MPGWSRADDRAPHRLRSAQLGNRYIPKRAACVLLSPEVRLVPTSPEAVKALRHHWAVAALGSDDEVMSLARRAFAEARGEWPVVHGDDADRVQALGSAYDIAARDLFERRSITDRPAERESLDEQIATAAARGFVLYALLPSATTLASLSLRAMHLRALAHVGGRGEQFEQWWEHHWTDPAGPESVSWDVFVPAQLARLWAELLRPPATRDIGRAMELIAELREHRELQEQALLSSIPRTEHARIRFYLFALYHCADAATDLLLAYTHGRDPELGAKLNLRFGLAHEATSGDVLLDTVLTWLRIAALQASEQDTMQLDLPGLSA